MLYIFSFFAYLFLKYVLSYRDNVISHNLVNAFPGKSPKELSRIQDKYVRHLADLLVENIKTLTASRRFLRKHITCSNFEFVEEFYRQKQDFITVMGHLGNWEWCGFYMASSGTHQLKAIYRPLKNKDFDRFFIRFRSRLGAKLIPMQQVAREFLRKEPEPFCFAFIADQTPQPDTAYWTHFLNRDTPFFDGYEKLARKFDLPVVFASVQRVKRGYYHIHTEILEAQPSQTQEHEITEKFVRRLEQKILEQPEYWLWSHRRWKHFRKST